jgi:glycosyltransferase involved in cell wall biosynthesis
MTSLCVMPVYNEIDRLGALLEACAANMPTTHFVIVDNGSDDGSAELIDASGFECVHLDRNHGIGYALRLGAEMALERGCDVCCNIAGNGKMRPEELSRILEPLASGQADYVTGSRFLEGGQYPNLPLFRRVAIPLVYNIVVLALFRRRFTDVSCGLRGFRTDLLRDERVDWQGDWLDYYQFEYYLYAKAVKLGYRCTEVPCSMIYPPSGRNYSKIPPIKGWWQMLQPWIYVGLSIR